MHRRYPVTVKAPPLQSHGSAAGCEWLAVRREAEAVTSVQGDIVTASDVSENCHAVFTVCRCAPPSASRGYGAGPGCEGKPANHQN